MFDHNIFDRSLPFFGQGVLEARLATEPRTLGLNGSAAPKVRRKPIDHLVKIGHILKSKGGSKSGHVSPACWVGQGWRGCKAPFFWPFGQILTIGQKGQGVVE